jgi:hypothetical protein
MAGYLRWTGMVPVTHEAIIVVERILGRQMGPEGRRIATVAEGVVAVSDGAVADGAVAGEAGPSGQDHTQAAASS